MKGNCNLDSSGTYPNEIANDAPGQPAGCKFIAPGEDISTSVANRTRYQLAHNCDIVKGPLDVMKAIGEVSAFTVTGGGSSSVTIDPDDGGGSDVSFDGSLYLGDTAGWPTGQEGRDLLFRLLDSDYNEVEVGGSEVVVSAVSEVIPGGFHATGIVTLTLSDTIPDGDYRLVYSRSTTLATLPEAGLMKLDVRGLTDAAAEMTYKSWKVCAVDTSAGPADFVGASAIQDALDAVGNDSVLFVRAGTYDLAAVGGGALTISQSRVRIIGEGADSLITNGVLLRLGAGESLTISGSGVEFENVGITYTSGGGSNVRVESSDFRMSGCVLNFVYLYLVPGADRAFVEKTKVENNVYGMNIAADYGFFVGCEIIMAGTGGSKGNPGLQIANSQFVSFVNCRIRRESTVDCSQVALELLHGNKEITFTNCEFASAQFPSLLYGGASVDVPTSARFVGCRFSNRPLNSSGYGYGPVIPRVVNVGQCVRLEFSSCRFETISTAWYPGPFVQLLSRHPHDQEAWTTDPGESLITLSNCYFKDNYCQGYTGTTDPPGDASGASVLPILQLNGVTGQGLIFERACPYDVLCSPWVDTERTNIADLRVVYKITERPCDTNIATPNGGLIRIGERSKIQKLRLTGNMGHGSELANGEWQRPVLNLFSGGVVTQGETEVDDFRIEQETNTDIDPYPVNWEFAATTTVVRVSYAMLRRFRWNTSTSTHRNSLSDAVATVSLVRLDDYGILKEARLGHSDNGKLLTYLVELSGVGSEVRDSYLTVSQPLSVNMTAVIAELASSSYLKILGNVVNCTSNLPTSNIVIDVSNSGADKMVSNNSIYVISGLTANLIDFGGSAGDDDNVCVGNIVHSSSGTPDIRPNTIVGYSTNLIY